MNNFIQKSLLNLFVISVFSLLFTAATQAATFSELMRLGIVNSNSSDKAVVIYNDDYTKCLSINGQKLKSAKSLGYTTCRMDDTDTWLITSVGKIKNKGSGKCLSTPRGEDNLVLVHCNATYFRNYISHDFIVFEQVVDEDHDGTEVAEVRY